MHSKNREKPKVYIIYALLHPTEEYCYIGKTSGRLSAAYSEHICQRIDATAGYFDKQEERPNLHLLGTIEGTRSIAYKHVVAWTRVFTDAGYILLNYDGTLRHAASLKPDTQAIVDQIRREPLETILERTRLEKPTDGDRPPKEKKDTGPLTQMNLRISSEDKAQFAAYCKSYGMTQREGFALLLDKTLVKGEPHHMQQMTELREKNEALAEENKKLKKKLAVMSGAELPESVQRSLALLPIQKEGIARYLEQTLPPEFAGEPLKRGSYRRYMKYLSPEESYSYPAEEGVLVLCLEAILWGNVLHRACFLIGVGEDKKRYKLRCYPREAYTGIGLDDERYVRQNARFLVAAQRAKDGAMELILAMPLPEVRIKADEVTENPKEKERKSSLDARIRAIKERK